MIVRGWIHPSTLADIPVPVRNWLDPVDRVMHAAKGVTG